MTEEKERFIENSKKAPTVLEKDGKQITCRTQEAVDAAWAEGYHAVGIPESAIDSKDIDPDKDLVSDKGPVEKEPVNLAADKKDIFGDAEKTKVKEPKKRGRKPKKDKTE